MAIGSPQWMYNSGSYQIDNSLRFNDGDVPELLWPASAHSGGNRRTFTHSLWAKRGIISSTHQVIFEARDGDSGSSDNIKWEDGQLSIIYQDGTLGRLKSTALFRDAGAWYHIVVAVDTTQGTNTDRIKVYVNGVQLTSFTGTNTYMDQDSDTRTSYASSDQQYGNSRHPDNDHGLDGYLAEVNFLDGVVATPSDFGKYDKYGAWIPVKYGGSYGNEGYYLDFKSSGVGTAGVATIGADRSGNTNHFTSSNIVVSDQMLDTPTNNFCVLNPNENFQGALSQGNLRVACNAGKIVKGTMGAEKYYFEWRVADNVDGGIGAGIGNQETKYATWPAFGKGHAYLSPGIFSTDGSETSGQTAYAVDDIISMTVDTTTATNNIKYRKNNTVVITRGYACDQFFLPTGFDGSSGTAGSMNFNFGADSSFGGLETAQGETDSNGQGDFYYEPPAGFLALCSKNLPEPAVIPSDYFNTVLYTGDNSGAQAISGVGFSPDFLWIKSRNDTITGSHELHDAVRGAGKRMFSNTNAIETDVSTVDSFDSDGFTVGLGTGGENGTNANGATFVAWNWKANGAGAANNTGSINTTKTSANVEAGFSMMTYTGSGSNATIGHGLSKVPEMWVVKPRTDAGDNQWFVCHKGFASDYATDFIHFDNNSAVQDNALMWNDSVPTTTVINLGTKPGTNKSGDSFLCYAWHSVDGYSKVGSYTGNGNVDGTFVYTGFRPAFIMFKNINAVGSWHMYDTKRNTFNVSSTILITNANNAEESDSSYNIDILSNGFKQRTTSSITNDGYYLYLAFAEMPFSNSNAR